MLDDSVGQHEATARPQSFGGIDFRCNAYGCSGLLRGRVPSWLLPLLLTTAAGCFLAGCRTETSTVDLEMATAETKPPEQNHFEIAVDFLKMRDEHNLDRSASQSAYHLNRWIRDQAADPRWMIDRPLLNTLPDAIRRARRPRRSSPTRLWHSWSFAVEMCCCWRNRVGYERLP